jgi:dolichol kinase
MFCYIYIGIGKVQLVMYTASIGAVTVAISDVQLQRCVPNNTLHSCPNCNCRYMAALVPLLQAIRLTAAGFAAAKQAANAPPTSSSSNSDAEAAAAVVEVPKRNSIVAALSRTGSAKEAVGGPLLYVLVIAAATLLEWRASLVGVLAVCQMAAGDGLADLVGRRCKGKKWWFSEHKSYIGSAAFVLGGTAASLGIIAWLHAMGCVAICAREAALRVLAISVACALVESGSWEGVDDNVSVPVAAAVLTRLLFPGM